jgi:hypothetical protein
MNARLPTWVSNSILVCLLIFLILFAVVSFENHNLREAYERLQSPSNFSFATIQEISRIKNRFPIVYQCHYTFAMPDGKLAESSETIPYSIYKKLKLGDPIQIYRMETLLFGRKTALSKIVENNEVPPLIDNLERFFRGGLLFFTFVGLFVFLFRVLGSRFQTYLFLQK